MSFPAVCPVADTLEWLPQRLIGPPMNTTRGLVLHVNEGNGDPAGWWERPTTPTASSHFQLMKSGELIQYVALDTVAWCQVAGSFDWHSIETEGFTTEPLTDNAVVKLSKLYAWGHANLGWALQVANSPADVGFGVHSMGGEAWGGHPCVPVDRTEVLTPTGWLPIGEAGEGTPVASWVADSGLIEFAKPLGVIAPHMSPTVRFRELEVTPDHRMYVRYSNTQSWKVQQAQEVGRNARIPLAGHLADPHGLNISDDLLRLLVHIQADGHLMRERSESAPHGIEWHYRKPRKIERLRALLSRFGDAKVTEITQSDGSTKIRVWGAEWTRAAIAELLPEKRFTWDWLGMSAAQFELFHEELMLADGCVSRQIYRSSDRSNLDIVQAIYHLNGRRATVEEGRVPGLRMTKSDSYRTRDATMCFYGKKADVGRAETLVSCLTTHNETLLIRQDGRVYIVGNCPGDIRSGQRTQILQLASQGDPFMTMPAIDANKPLDMNHPDIRTAQGLLAARGAWCAPLQTNRAVLLTAIKWFQTEAKLPVDGVMGPATWIAAAHPAGSNAR